MSQMAPVSVTVALPDGETDSVLRVSVAPLRFNDGRTVAVGVRDGAAGWTTDGARGGGAL